MDGPWVGADSSGGLVVRCRSLMEDVEHLYAAIFCHGSIDVARTSLHGRASMRVQVCCRGRGG